MLYLSPIDEGVFIAFLMAFGIGIFGRSFFTEPFRFLNINLKTIILLIAFGFVIFNLIRTFFNECYQNRNKGFAEKYNLDVFFDDHLLLNRVEFQNACCFGSRSSFNLYF